MIIAIPSEAPGGIEAAVSPHFGHCDVFTLVDVDGDRLKGASVLPNCGHEQGGCMGPVMLLKNAGVDVLVAGGMGRRPLLGFQQVGIEVWFSENLPSVGEVIELAQSGRARAFGPQQACGGGHDADNCHGSH